jgi:hypothetical protein
MGLYTQMGKEDPVSPRLLRNDLYNSVASTIAEILGSSLRAGFLPNPKLKVKWSPEERLWVTELACIKRRWCWQEIPCQGTQGGGGKGKCSDSEKGLFSV